MKKTALILLLMISGCASTGIKIDSSKLSQLHKGETTYSEVLQKFGKPSQTIMPGDGTTTVMYIYVSTQARPETFIPIAGAFMGGADSENSTVTMKFDADNILQKVTSSQGSFGTGTGFEANSLPRNYGQPSNSR